LPTIIGTPADSSAGVFGCRKHYLVLPRQDRDIS
jgi:hypothetical protein